jgi:inositol hexakisphosphate/diphosphoinositol-pentakisphosphate kinase
MINMDYSADLPINTMGRRIRTRLYFTSESHLHTMLNVLRFAGKNDDDDTSRPVLSDDGMEFISNTRELCYLTQIVIRLFEDTSRVMEDPRRFRVEILFSPGACATPLHMHEANRDRDTTRLDTEPLQVVGRGDLTCQEIEEFFGSAILEGGHNTGDDHIDVASASTADVLRRPLMGEFIPPSLRQLKIVKNIETSLPEGLQEEEEVNEEEGAAVEANEEAPSSDNQGDGPTSENGAPKEPETNKEEETNRGIPVPPEGKTNKDDLTHKYFWSAVAMGTLLLGSGCLVMALSLTGDSRNRRRYTRR